MNYQRFLIEFGTGVDLHGMDATKAAQKAIKDAISHCCLCGVREILNVKDPGNALHIQIKIGAPEPEKINTEELMHLMPFGTPEFEVVQGGLYIKGLREPKFGDGDHILLVNAALTVWIDTDMTGDIRSGV